MTTPPLSINLILVEEMTPKNIHIKVNEKEILISSNTSLFQLKNQFKPNTDVIIYWSSDPDSTHAIYGGQESARWRLWLKELGVKSIPVNSDCPLIEGDEIVFIKKGELPSPEEFESLMMSRHTPGIHQKIKKSIVGIAGLGGLGSAIAIALARIGVGKLILVDFDVVEPSNLNRQQYFIHQIGMPKVEALQENLSKINPHIRILIYHEKLDRNNIEKIFKEVEVVVEAFDRSEEKAMLINAVSEKMPDKYIVAASGVAGYGDNNEIKTIRFSSKIFIVGDQETAAQPGVGLMAPRVGIAAHHQANTVLRILLGEEK